MRNATRAFCETLHVIQPKKDSNVEKEEKAEEEEKEEKVETEDYYYEAEKVQEVEKEREMEDLGCPLKGLVFVVYGSFSMPKEMMENLIVTYGG
jgi:hypothetical protein